VCGKNSQNAPISKSQYCFEFGCTRCPAHPPRETIEAKAIEAKAIPKIPQSQNLNIALSLAAPAAPPTRREKPSKQRQSKQKQSPKSPNLKISILL